MNILSRHTDSSCSPACGPEGEQEFASYARPSFPSEPADEVGLETARTKKEIRLLAFSALVFFLSLLLTEELTAAFGPASLYAVYAVPYLLCGVPIFKEAYESIRQGSLFNEFTLMSGATVAAVALGELPEAVGVMLFYRTGEFLQERASAGSRRSIKKLLATKPTSARRVVGGGVVEVLVEEIEPGEQVLVRAGEKIPLDGTVVAGESLVDQSPLTGESVPITVREGSAVLGGTVNMDGVLTITASGRFADTHMARILEMVEHAAMNKSPTERFITTFARYYTPAVVFLATLTALVPPLIINTLWPGVLADPSLASWIYRALVLLVISCPCALLISIPLGYFGGIGAASRNGILVKGGYVMDSLAQVNSVIFDKTGTLTKGVFDVTELHPAPGVTETELLRAAAAAERESNHPIARSILAYAAQKQIMTAAPDSAQELSGKGMSVQAQGNRLLAGNSALLVEHDVAFDASAVLSEAAARAGTLVHIALNRTYLGSILVNDIIREDSREAVGILQNLGLKTYMLTGDRIESAEWVAREAGINGYRAGLLPGEKVDAARGLVDIDRAAFVGDGINDAPILAVARVGIAMGGIGSEAAVEASDAVILNDSPANVARLFSVAKDVRSVVLQNIALALGVKGIVMAFGIAGLSGLWEAVFADVGVALLAVLNASRVMRKKG